MKKKIKWSIIVIIASLCAFSAYFFEKTTVMLIVTMLGFYGMFFGFMMKSGGY